MPKLKLKIDAVCKVGLGFPSGWSSSPRGPILFELCLVQESLTSKTIRSSELKTDTPQGRDKGLVVRRERHRVFYLLAMQWISFWGADWTLSMGIFITEGGGNWGWRETVGKADKHHQYNRFGFFAKMGNTYIHSAQSTTPLHSRLKTHATNTLGPNEGASHSPLSSFGNITHQNSFNCHSNQSFGSEPHTLAI